jgi:type II secretory pathway component PulF
MNAASAFRAIRSGRDKAAYYRMWHVRQRAGLAYPDDPSPGPQVPFETAIVALGMESGKLEECLRLLGDYFTAEDRMVLKVIKQATYPMFLALAGAVIGPLPLAFKVGVGAYLVSAGALVALWLMAGGSLLMGTVNRYLNQSKYVRGRLLRALTIGIEAGLTVGRAATLAAEATGNAEVIGYVRRSGAKAVASQPLAQTFRGCPHVPAHAVAAMEVAERSGNYAGTLKKMAELEES